MKIKTMFLVLFFPTFLILHTQTKDHWIPTDSTKYRRWYHTSTLLNNGKVLITGGISSEDSLLANSSCELYDPTTHLWSTVKPMNIGRFSHAAVLLDNGKVLVSGGATENYTTSSYEIYDPSTNTWETVSSMNQKREGHVMIKLNDGKVLVCGGGAFDMTSGTVTNTCEIYDPLTDEWNYISPMNNSMNNHKGIILNNGNIMVGGATLFWGWDGVHYEIYDVQTNKWDTIPSPFYNHSATPSLSLLNDGTVLVIGDTTISEIYAPTNNTWIISDTLSFQENNYSIIHLNDNYILIVGKNEKCEIYDSFTNSFLPAADKPSYQKDFTLTKLFNGAILLTGGIDSTGITNKCLLYIPDSALVGVKNINETIPVNFILFQNYPNPFNPSTTIKYSLKVDGKVVLTVKDILGKPIKTLVNKWQPKGNYEIRFDTENKIASGIYFYTLSVNDFTETKKLVITK